MGQQQKPLFLRNATGLIRAWSTYDSFVYSALSINIVTLGLFAFSNAGFFGSGNLIAAVLISAPFIFFEILAYVLLIAVMPRAGGDYVWQSRVLTGSIGYILSITGYVFILWQWGPIYGNILSIMVMSPIATVLGNVGAAVWWSGSSGIFASSIITIVLVSIFIALGMKWYARIQKWSFHIGIVGLLTLFAILAAFSQSTFVSDLNSNAGKLFSNSTAYSSTLGVAQGGGIGSIAGVLSFGSSNFSATFSLIPIVVFFNLYPIWGATLYGEVRGSSDFKRNLKALTSSLVFTTILAVIMLLLFAKTFGWEFYQSSNYVYWGSIFSYNPSPAPLPVFPYPGLLASFLTHNLALSLFMLIALSFFYWGWAGTLFMTSTRAMFAASFDRVLPSWFADVSTRFRTPLKAIIAMAIPTAIFSYLYSYVAINKTPFSTFSLDAVLVIAVMYLGTAIAAAILPFRKKSLYESSPIAKYKVGGIPLISIAGVITAGFMAWLTYAWATNSTYGVNNKVSVYYLLILYAIAVILYFSYKYYRKSQGIEMDKLYSEIPVE